MSVDKKTSWRPTATLETLRKRAETIQKIRQFFIAREVLEVETPLLAHHGVTDCHVENITADYQGEEWFLQTSPEYHMKRLLCAGSPSIFQISKAFRHESVGRKHNIEFTMLEWYRLGFSMEQLMAEVGELLQLILSCPKAIYTRYEDAFMQHLNINPHTASVDELKSVANFHQLGFHGELTRDGWLDLLMGCLIEPKLGLKAPEMIYDYPKSQAALAVVSGEVAKRFEVYVAGVEIANGFDELRCDNEQLQRFNQDNVARSELGLRAREIDKFFVDALQEGRLPQCAGVALGVDRLLMCMLKASHIQDVMAFPSNIA